MATPQAAPDDRLTCEQCHGFYAVEVPEDGGDPRVRCNTCGHIREVSVTPVQKEEPGKWTVIGPDGKVMTFGSWDKLVESRRPAALAESAAGSASKIAITMPDEKKPSATALLDITPTPAMPTLALAEADSDPNLLAAKAAEGAAELAQALAKKKGPEWAPIKTETKAPPKAKAPASVAELDAAALVDDDEPAPLSLRDAIPDDDDEPAPLSLRDAIQIQDDDSAHEMLSMKDLVVVPPADDSAVDSTPPPPARGALRTLPPTPSKQGDAAPPPTITVEEPVDSARGKKLAKSDGAESSEDDAKNGDAKKSTGARGDAKNDDAKADAKKNGGAAATTKKDGAKADGKKDGAKTDGKKDGAKADGKKDGARTDGKKDGAKAATTKKGAASKDERKPVASARASVAEEEPKRGWVLPSLAVIAVTVVLWRLMSSSSDPTPATSDTTTTETPATKESPDPTAATTSSPADTATAAPADTATASPADTTATVTAPGTATATTTTAPPATRATRTPVAVGDKPATTTAAAQPTAGAADKKPATAESGGASMSDLLDRAGSARRSGDYATARELYQRVLKQNPGNVEANGGLGDVARAQGDLSSAKSSYERALAASPSYGPAQLGLADTEWDLGNRAGAQRRYAQVVERLGERAPERAKQRGVVTE